jgi:hypothetical protein
MINRKPTDWLPAHILVVHVLLLFSLLNPLVIPFATFYFFIESGTFLSFHLNGQANLLENLGIVKNQVCNTLSLAFSAVINVW